MCCAHELRRRPPTDASRAGRNRAARHRPSHASSKLTPTRSTSRFLDRLRRSKTDGSCRLHGHQTIRRDAQGRLEPRLPDAPLGDILGCVKTDAEAVDLTLFSTASGGRFSLRPTTPSAPVSFLLPGCRGSRRSRLASCHPPPGSFCSRRTRDKLRVSPGGER